MPLTARMLARHPRQHAIHATQASQNSVNFATFFERAFLYHTCKRRFQHLKLQIKIFVSGVVIP